LRPYPRTRQVDESLKEVLAEIIERRITDPRLEFVTITGVSVSRDVRYATVYVTAHGGAERYADMLAGFDSAKGRIRALLGEQMTLKFTPELTFVVDESVDEGARIDRALATESVKEKGLSEQRHEARAAKAGTDGAAPTEGEA
jgi:ribosome-binding factor A